MISRLLSEKAEKVEWFSGVSLDRFSLTSARHDFGYFDVNNIRMVGFHDATDSRDLPSM